MTPEGKVKKECKDYLASIDACIFMPVQTGYGSNALDIICCWRGLYIEIETKRRGGKPTLRQMHRAEDVFEAGGHALIVDDVGQLKGFFEQLMKHVA